MVQLARGRLIIQANSRATEPCNGVRAIREGNILERSDIMAFLFSSTRRFFSSSISPVKILGVCGSGQMGTGIALVGAARAGVEKVLLLDSNPDALERSKAFASKWMEKEVGKGRMTNEERESFQNRLVPTSSIEALAEADFVIEAIVENLEAKQELLSKVAGVVSPDTILASNTSSISITKIASVAPDPTKVIGMHFMNPVPVMKLVEVIRGLATSEDTLHATLQLCERMQKITSSSTDMPGFIANRILVG